MKMISFKTDKALKGTVMNQACHSIFIPLNKEIESLPQTLIF